MKGPATRASDKIYREYRAILLEYTRRMNADVLAEISRAYGRREGEFLPDDLTGDASASVYLERLLARLFGKWGKRFASMAEKRAAWFAKQTEKASTGQMQKMLKDIGFTVEFKNSHYVNNVLQATVIENTKLITSVPQQMHDKVQGIVMRGVQAGQDRAYIAREMKKQFGISERRAQFIARDQVQKATGSVALARSAEAGIEYGFWAHRSGSKKPRRTHVAMNGKRFKLSEGLYDSDPRVADFVKPRELPGCNCAYRPDLSSYNPQLAAESVSIRPVKPTYATILKRASGKENETA